MKHRFTRSAAALACVLLLTAARAAEPPAPLPEDVAAHVTLRAPEQFVGTAVDFIDAATQGTGRHIPPQFLSMMIAAYLPVPFGVWSADSPLHLVFLDGENMHTMLVVFGHDGFPELLAGLEEADWDVPARPLDNEDEDLFREVRMVAMANGTPMFLADLGDGRAVLTEHIDIARRTLHADGLDLDGETETDIAARIRFAGMEEVSEDILRALTKNTDDMLQTVAEAGLTEASGAWLAEMAATYGRRAGSELEKIEELLVELDIDGERLSLAAGARFADGAWTNDWAATMEAAATRPATALAAALPEGAFSLVLTAPSTETFPDARAMAATLLSDLARLAPDHKAALDSFADTIFAAGPGDAASASYLNEGKQLQITATEFADAAAAMEAVNSFCDTFGKIITASFANPAESFSLVSERREADSLEWVEWRFEPANGEQFDSFLDRLYNMNSNADLRIVFHPGFRIHIAALKKPEALIMLSGETDADAFARTLRGIAEKAAAADASSPFDAPEAAAAVAAVEPAQLSVGIADPEEVVLAVSLRLAEQAGVTLPRAAFSKSEPAAAPAAFGMGAEDGRVTLRAAVPAAALRAGIRKYEHIIALDQEEAARKQREAQNRQE